MHQPFLAAALALGLLALPVRAATYSSELEKSLLVAAFKSDPEWVAKALEAGASPNARFYGDAFGEEDALDFGVGLMEDFPAFVRLVQANDGRLTALMLATINGSPEIVRLLLARRADPNKRCGKLKDTPLMFAARNQNRAIATLLLDAGADPTLTNAHGETALTLATRHGDRELAELLRARSGG